MMPRARKYPEELLERGARLVFESGRRLITGPRERLPEAMARGGGP